MYSSIPKVIHPIGGKPMLQHVIQSCSELGADKTVVIYGHEGEQVRQLIEPLNPEGTLHWVEQAEQKGTGHAVDQAHDLIDDDSIVVVAYGDVPLIQPQTLRRLVDKVAAGASLCVLTTRLDDPSGYGRIIRDQNKNVVAIVEEKDATDEQRRIDEINTGFIAANGADLKRWLKQLSPDNAQGEYYLTDCIALAAAEGRAVEAVVCANPDEVQGVNNRLQQAALERAYQKMQADNLMLSGVTLLDPARCDIRGVLKTGKDVMIDVNVIFEGDVTIGDGVRIESGCVIRDSVIGDHATIKHHSILENAAVGSGCDVGPFARLRPGAELKANAKVGNFVEVKKSTIGEGSKVSHLSYIGDTQMGKDVNIGAGTITCNYDGANKFQTTIGDHVFVGSDTQLVAPVTIHEGATIGAGSTITRDTPSGELTLSRVKQTTIKGWQRPVKKTEK